jgi:hypothetical protein
MSFNWFGATHPEQYAIRLTLVSTTLGHADLETTSVYATLGSARAAAGI